MKEGILIKIYLKRDIVESQSLSDKAKMTYVALKKIYKLDMPDYYINIKMLIYALKNDIASNRYLNDALIVGIDELLTNKIINQKKKISQTERVLNLSLLYFKTTDKTFTIIEDADVFKIMNTHYKCTNYNLLSYYISRIGSISAKDMYNEHFDCQVKKDIGYMSKSYFIDNCKLSEATIYTYNKILSDEKLIYIYKPTLYKNISGKIISFSGVYGEYKNKDKIIECGKALQEAFMDGCLYKKTDSNIRSLSNKFRYIRDNGKVYEYGEMKTVYNAMVERNKKIREHYYDDELFSKYKKDLSVFKDYDFYN